MREDAVTEFKEVPGADGTFTSTQTAYIGELGSARTGAWRALSGGVQAAPTETGIVLRCTAKGRTPGEAERAAVAHLNYATISLLADLPATPRNRDDDA